ncbi:hypothetical protein O7623_30445 [Solwaraspora sp. WMMD791]|uniref:hypothetical protein n=1 Tax=Solwaraspora sp. WMMD791 TaxID=3016086 RepID=UPI00249AA5FB|nr:hypothetical protein [Solwaraspora sp. WMMD791]WFE27486.1 hypothetical protein O7623_30445 [Solwaraspora sp. WMMD791]
MDPSTTAAMRSAAACNNAAWCAAVSRSHGCPDTVDDAAWCSARRTPPYYPDAVTLRPDATPADLLGRIDTTSPGCSVKDSFATLDLGPDGFVELFTADWIHRPAGLPVPTTPTLTVLTVRQVTTAAELHEWQAAWHGDDSPVDVFRPALLREPSVRIFSLRADGDRVAGGFVLTCAEGVVGLSNLFATDSVHRSDVWAAAINEAPTNFPGLPLVGYEQGDDLSLARTHGFRPIGALRVWLHQP